MCGACMTHTDTHTHKHTTTVCQTVFTYALQDMNSGYQKLNSLVKLKIRDINNDVINRKNMNS